MEYKKITVVDEQDDVIGYFSYDEAIAQKMIRRASVVFIFDEEGRILIQKRSKHISNAQLLDKSCAGHVDEGENYLQTAVRELHEELGLEGYEPIEVIPSIRNENFFDAVFKIIIPSSTQIDFDTHEVESIQWMTIDELDHKINEQPELFTTNFIKLWAMVRDKLFA